MISSTDYAGSGGLGERLYMLDCLEATDRLGTDPGHEVKTVWERVIIDGSSDQGWDPYQRLAMEAA